MLPFFLILFGRLNHRLKKDLSRFISFFNQATHSDKEIDKQTIKFFELDQMAENANKMMADRKKAEKALRGSEERWRGIIKNAAIGIYQATDQGNFEMVNPMFANIFGYKSPKAFLTNVTNISDLYLNPDDRPPILREMNTKGLVDGAEAQFRHKDGKTIWLRISARAIKDVPDKIIYEGFMSDITDIKKAHQALQESELWVRNIFKSLNEAVFVITPDRKFIDMNETAQKMFGYTKKELVGQYSEIVHVDHEHNLKFGEKMKEVIHKGGITDYQFEMRRKNGDIFPTEHTASLMVDYQGKPAGIVSVIRDLSERKKMEEEKKALESQLQRAQKMESIGTLAGGVAHDLNNILSGIVSYPELILMDLPEDSPLRKPISVVKQSGEKAATIVQDLLTLARRGVSISEVVNLNDIISEQLKSPEFEKLQSFNLNMKVEVQLEKGLLNIKGSKAHLSKSFMNLISNAAEAISEDGIISVSTENRYMDRPIAGYDHVEQGDYAVVTVSDTGVGMSSEDMEKIFEPFYTKKTMGRSGTGLGMSVVWGTVKDHNGYIDLLSKEGKGSKITIYFPATREMTDAFTYVVPVEDYMGEGETILVVDDVEEQRVIASNMLEKLGYSVASVSSGEEAVEYIKNHTVDLLVLDMIMDPGIDGLETYKRILKLYPEQKAIIASGFSETPRVKETLKLGAGAYVKKPYLMEKMGVAIKTELEK